MLLVYSWCHRFMIERMVLQDTIQNALGRSRVVALIGPRQCGKITMARLFVSIWTARRQNQIKDFVMLENLHQLCQIP